ncbi:MAG TPA: response regulator transcription factor [Ilumatobacteraceae bacterium]|nr:response regulator transcription factor [Ilumatobacteraceae bacterium]
MTDRSLNVLVVDDHDLLREGVSGCLSAFDDIDVVGEARSGEAALDAAHELDLDVVVIDLVMPGMGGLEAIRRLRVAHTDLGIVALSSFSSAARVRETVDAGANAYLIKSVDVESLARAVRNAAEGVSTFSPEATLALVERSKPVDPGSSLTPREAEIARLLALGKTNAEMADELTLSVFTVKNHVSSILMKLQVRTRTEAAIVLSQD